MAIETYYSLFSGIEAASVAFKPLGWRPLVFSEIEPFPCAVLKARFPEVPNLGDIRDIDWAETVERCGRPDLVVGGSPCFPAGALVLAKRGFVPIEEIVVGDEVLTHKNRWRKVTAVGHQRGDTVMVKAQGTPGIECTPNHPFLACERKRAWNNAKRGWDSFLTEPVKTRADELKGKMVFSTGACDSLDIPEIEKPDLQHGANELPNVFTCDFFYMLGRYLGDGSLLHGGKHGKDAIRGIVISEGYSDANELESSLRRLNWNWRIENGRTAVRFRFHSRVLGEWVLNNFGHMSYQKRVPAWCFGLDDARRRALLQGYLDSDGCRQSNGWHATTTSRMLAISIKMLAASFGHATSITKWTPKRPYAVIEGRRVNERETYAVTIYDRSHVAKIENRGFWGGVRSVEPCRENVTVYNITVDEDHSYTVDGIWTKNCQSFSISGNRKGLQGASGLMWEYVRAIREVRPRWLLWENVPGALSSSHGEDFRCLLESLASLGYGLGYRVLDSQFFDVPQRRERLFLVGCLGDPRRAAEVLFEPESLPWHPQSSREKRASLTGGAGSGAQAAGGADAGVTGTALTGNREHQNSRVYATNGPSPTLMSQHGRGAQPPVVLAEDICVQGNIARGARMGQNGCGYSTDGSAYTLDTLDIPAVVESAGFVGHTPATSRGVEFAPEQSPTLTCADGHCADGHCPCVLQRTGIYEIQGNAIGREPENGPGGKGWCDPDENGAYTLNTADRHAVMAPVIYIGGDHKASESIDCAGTLLSSPGGFKPGAVMCMADATAHAAIDEDMCGCLQAHAYKEPPLVAMEHAVAFAANQRGELRLQGGDGDVFGALPTAWSGKQAQGVCQDDGHGDEPNYIVRRLTPLECERLQAFPDRWTEVPYRGKPADQCPDGPRYKALGNSMTTTVMRWIGEGIDLADDMELPPLDEDEGFQGLMQEFEDGE